MISHVAVHRRLAKGVQSHSSYHFSLPCLSANELTYFYLAA
uniref:Uncharacterized protein n=1 Tax=Rhizophora mucronata TaxID=61149 RepID=A0A2P2M7A3_RHIMU